MKKLLCALLIVGIASAAFAASKNAPAEKAYPFQLSLFSPVSIIKAEDSVNGLCLNILYGNNENVTGYDFGFLVNHVSGDLNGYSYGLINLVGGNVNGAQGGIMNWTEGSIQGWQCGAINYVGEKAGVQLAFIGVNWAQAGASVGQIGLFTINVANDDVANQFAAVNYSDGNVAAAQLGAVNVCLKDSNMQVGLANVLPNGDTSMMYGGVNWGSKVNGLQMGIVNYATDVKGLQFGAVNYTDGLNGLQIGILNFAMGKDSWKILPIVNAAW